MDVWNATNAMVQFGCLFASLFSYYSTTQANIGRGGECGFVVFAVAPLCKSVAAPAVQLMDIFIREYDEKGFFLSFWLLMTKINLSSISKTCQT